MLLDNESLYDIRKYERQNDGIAVVAIYLRIGEDLVVLRWSFLSFICLQ